MPITSLSALCAALVLCSCASSRHAPQDVPADVGRTARPSVGVGFLGGIAERNEEPDFDGPALGGRVDVAFPVAGPHLELGLRGSFGYAFLEPDVQPASANLELDAWQFALAPLARVWFADERASVRPYAEGFVGHHWTDLELTARGFGNASASISDDDSGLFFGLGGGVGIPFGDGDQEAVLGVEWTRSEFDADVDADTLTGHVGVRWRF